MDPNAAFEAFQSKVTPLEFVNAPIPFQSNGSAAATPTVDLKEMESSYKGASWGAIISLTLGGTVLIGVLVAIFLVVRIVQIKDKLSASGLDAKKITREWDKDIRPWLFIYLAGLVGIFALFIWAVTGFR